MHALTQKHAWKHAWNVGGSASEESSAMHAHADSLATVYLSPLKNSSTSGPELLPFLLNLVRRHSELFLPLQSRTVIKPPLPPSLPLI